MDDTQSLSMRYGLLCVLALLGCGGSETSISGAGGGISSTTGGTGGMSTTSAERQTVHPVDDYGDPQADLPVVVNDAAGAVVEVDRTAADGTVSVHVPPGGSVSVFQAQTTSLSVRTVVDPPPGSVVRFPPRHTYPKEASIADTTTYQVTFTNFPPETKRLVVSGGSYCDIAQANPVNPKATLSDAHCGKASSHRLIAVANDAQDQPLSWAEQTVGVAPGETMPVTIDVGKNTATSSTIMVTGIPGAATSAYMAGGITGGWYGGSAIKHAPPTAPVDSAVVRSIGAPNLNAILSARLAIGDSAGSWVGWGQQFEPAALPASWTFAAGAPSWVLVAPADLSVPDQMSFDWSTADPQDADVIYLWAGWTIGIGSVRYGVELPPNHVGSWRIPDVPDELSGYRPHGLITPDTVAVTYKGWETVANYGEVIGEQSEDNLYASYTERGARSAPVP